MPSVPKSQPKNLTEIAISSPVSSPISSRVRDANSNPLARVEQLKRSFISTKLSQLRTSIYAELRRANFGHVYALAELDRALADVAAAVTKLSQATADDAAKAELAARDDAWVRTAATTAAKTPAQQKR
jgi:hypothetical protein